MSLLGVWLITITAYCDSLLFLFLAALCNFLCTQIIILVLPLSMQMMWWIRQHPQTFLIRLGLFLTRHPDATLHHVLSLILLICLICLTSGAVRTRHRVSHLVVPQILAQPGTILLLPWAMPLIWATTWSPLGVVDHPPLVTHSLKELYSRNAPRLTSKIRGHVSLLL